METNQLVTRFDALVANGFGGDADVRWFTGPAGFLELCRWMRAEERFDHLESPGFVRLLEQLDDRSSAFERQLPSVRATVLATVATGRPFDADELARALFPVQAGDAHEPAATRAAASAMADLEGYFAGRDPDRGVSATAAVVVSRHSRGEVLRFIATRSDRPGCRPDLLDAPFQRFDPSFMAAVADAAVAVGAGRIGVRYSVVSARTQVPVEAIGGRSIGLGAAVAIRRLADQLAPPLDPDWVLTGDVDATGAVLPLATADRSQDYRRKLESIGHRTLLHPLADRAVVDGLAEGLGSTGGLHGVSTVDDAEVVIRRHMATRAAFERVVTDRVAIDERRPLLRRAGVLAGALVAGIAVFAVAAAIESYLERREMRSWREQAAGVTVPVTAPESSGVDPFLVDRFEVSNRQYRLCVDHGGCRDNTESSDGDSRANPDLPAQAVLAEDAERFCEWVHGDGWGLPTFEQWQASVIWQSRSSWPNGEAVADLRDATDLPTEVEPVVSAGPNVDGELVGAVGNLSEWTRTACDDDGCRPVDHIGSAYLVLRRAGIPFGIAGDPSVMTGTAWLTDPGDLNFLSPTNASDPDFGFRCAERSA